MKKTKSTKEASQEVVIANQTNESFEIEESKISELTEGFGRADLDLMRDKINEIIKSLK